MKLPRPKIHILDCEDPLFAFRDLVCRCGITLHNAEIKISAAQDMSECVLVPPGTCLECRQAEPVGEATRMFIYFLVEAQEEKDYRTEEDLAVVA